MVLQVAAAYTTHYHNEGVGCATCQNEPRCSSPSSPPRSPHCAPSMWLRACCRSGSQGVLEPQIVKRQFRSSRSCIYRPFHNGQFLAHPRQRLSCTKMVSARDLRWRGNFRLHCGRNFDTSALCPFLLNPSRAIKELVPLSCFRRVAPDPGSRDRAIPSHLPTA